MINKRDLLKLSDSFKKEADGLLRRFNLQKQLSQYGEFYFIGSYELNVLFRRDIDICICPSKMSKEAIEKLVIRLIKSHKFQTVGFADIYNYKVERLPRGFFVELRVKYKLKFWKIDIWFTQDKHFAIKKTEKVKRLMEKYDGSRLKILQLKQEFYDGTKYKNGIKGIDIYESVLLGKKLKK